jgi:hypothetical protein
VLLNLADAARKDQRRAWPSVATIAEAEGLGRRSVQRSLHRLRELGLIDIEHAGGGYRATTCYVLRMSPERALERELWDDERGATVAPHPDGERGATDDTRGATDGERGATDDTRGATVAPKPVKNLEVTRKGNLKPRSTDLERVRPEVVPAPSPNGSVSDPEGFREFWSAYPNHQKRSEAVKSFRRAVLRDGPDRIAAGLETWVRYWAADGTEQRFIPHPTTWLNQNRYEDTPPRPAKTEPKAWDAIREALADRLAEDDQR